MTPLWRAQHAADATGGTVQGNWEVSGVSIDTRTLAPGDLFVALTHQRDGHEFVAAALEIGAGAALVSRVPDGVAEDAPLLIVPDVLKALEDLAQAARKRTGAKVVAITGSVGKTSSKDMIKTILSGQGRTHAAEDSYNNQWGVPLTLARMPADTEFAVIEIGMNHPGEIAPLARLARPDVALITNVAAVHLEAFDDLAGIAAEKAAIFAGLVPGGVAVINLDQAETAQLEGAAKQAGARVVGFGRNAAADYHLDDVQVGDATTVVTATGLGKNVLLKISAPGRHLAMNALGALAASVTIGADLAVAACDLGNWQPPSGRGSKERIVLDVVEDHLIVTLIDDAFNANPTSLAAALEVLAASTPGQKAGTGATGQRVAILGDMLELGPTERQLHLDIAKQPAIEMIDRFHCVGPRMRWFYEALPPVKRGEWVETAEEMRGRVSRLVHAGDIILVKGSKGSLVSRVVDVIRKLGHPLEQDAKGNS